MEMSQTGRWSALGLWWGWLGLTLVALGEALIISGHRPFSDFSFPVVWFGYITFMDAVLRSQRGWSPFSRYPWHFAVLFVISAPVWWLFEWFDQAVHNWQYLVVDHYSGLAYIALASLDFSTVIPAVYLTALALDALPAYGWLRGGPPRPVPHWALIAWELAGIACVVLPVLWPRYFFGLIWGATYFLLDPINCLNGRPSMIAAVWRGAWRLPIMFAVAALNCGFFWEAWNYWAMPKWIYHVPYVGFWHVFEMPLLGFTGYLPFGLELFAMANFGLWLLRLAPITLPGFPERTEAAGIERAAR